MPGSRPRGTSGCACGELIPGRWGNPQNCLLDLGWNRNFLPLRWSTLRKGCGGGICPKWAPSALPAPPPLPGDEVGKWDRGQTSLGSRSHEIGVFFHTLMVIAVLWQRILFAEATCAPRMEILRGFRNAIGWNLKNVKHSEEKLRSLRLVL